jgi:hypothetical protein
VRTHPNALKAQYQNQLTFTDTQFIINNASGHGPRDGPMVVANRWSHHRGKRHPQRRQGRSSSLVPRYGRCTLTPPPGRRATPHNDPATRMSVDNRTLT